MERDFLSLNWNIGDSADITCKDSVNGQKKSSSISMSAPFPFIKTTDGNSGLMAPMTIFYSGAVHVYNHISPEKVEAIMKIAASGLTETKQIPIPKGINIKKIQCHQTQPYRPQNSSETFKKGSISMARKTTLDRFLKNRKARLINVMPYNSGGKSSGIPQKFYASEI